MGMRELNERVPTGIFSFLLDCLTVCCVLTSALLFSSWSWSANMPAASSADARVYFPSPIWNDICVTSLLDSNVLFILFDANVVGMRELLIS